MGAVMAAPYIAEYVLGLLKRSGYEARITERTEPYWRAVRISAAVSVPLLR